MSLYKFLNVYEALRIDGIQNAFHPPEIIYPLNLDAFVMKKKEHVVMTKTAINTLKSELAKQGGGFIKYIIEYNQNFIVGFKKDFPPKTKDIIKRQHLIETETKNLIDEQKNVREEIGKEAFNKLEQGYPLNRIIKETRLEFENKKRAFEEKVRNLKNEIMKYKTGENLSAMAVPAYKKTFNLKDKSEINKKVGKVVSGYETDLYFKQLQNDRLAEEKLQLKKKQLQEEALKKEKKAIKKKNDNLFQKLEANIKKRNNKQKYGCVFFNSFGISKTKYSEDINSIKAFMVGTVSDFSINSIKEEELGDLNYLLLKNTKNMDIPVIIKRYYIKAERIIIN